MAKRRGGQMELALPAGWGGRRAGAGRKRRLERPGPPHGRRTGVLCVRLNLRKHLRAAATMEPRGAGIWFAGWRTRQRVSNEPCQVAAPRTWLAAVGWRLAGGLLDPRDGPARGAGRGS